MKRLFSGDTIGLWAIVAIIIALYSGSLIGINWGLDERNAFGRLLLNPNIAIIQIGTIILLFVLIARSKKQPDWWIVVTAYLFAAISIYHSWYYLVGTDILIWVLTRTGLK